MVLVLAVIVVIASLSLTVAAQDAGAAATSSPSPTPGMDRAETHSAAAVPSELGVLDAALSPPPLVVTVEAGDVWFAPTDISIESGKETVLALRGVGSAAHNLIIDELGLQLHVGPGITSEIDVSELPPGTYQFYCSIYGHARAGMVGTLRIESPLATVSPEPVT